MTSRIRIKRGFSLVEVLVGIVVVVVASIATLNYFAYSLGSVNKQGNRRAALERARERLEQLMAVNVNTITPVDNALYFVSCTGVGTCGPLVLADPNNTVTLNNIPGQFPIQSTVQCQDDPSAGTLQSTCDVLELSTKAWFMRNPALDDDFHRVHIRTLRSLL